MNDDRISRTPGGERMLLGGVVFAIALFVWHGLEYELGMVGKSILILIMGYGAVQFGRGLFEWKYADRAEFARRRESQSLYIDIPVKDRNYDIVNHVEDELAELIQSSKSIVVDIYSIDTANNIGTIHLRGKNADAMFAHAYSVLSRFAQPNGLHLFPKAGQPVDTELNGKRVIMDLPGMEISV